MYIFERKHIFSSIISNFAQFYLYEIFFLILSLKNISLCNFIFMDFLILFLININLLYFNLLIVIYLKDQIE